jgi:hypothetical protein
MAWTDLEKYTDLVNIYTRDAEGTALRHTYRPTRSNVILEGKAIKVRVLTPSVSEDVDSSFPTNKRANTIVPLTSFTKRIAFDYDQGEEPDVSSPADKMAITENHGSGHITKALTEFYNDVCTNGGEIKTGAASPTGAQIEAAINEAIAEINARNGGYNAAIVFTTSAFKLWVKQVGTLFQRTTDVHDPTKAGGPFRGYYQGFACYVSPHQLTDQAATPTNVSCIVYDEMGVSYAPMEVQFKIDPFDPRGLYVILSRFHFGVGVLSDEMAYYLLDSA